VKEHGDSLSSFFDFSPAVEAVKSLLLELQSEQRAPASPFRLADFTRLSLMGFSQGAALSYCLLLDDPQCYQRLAALAGFLPADNDTALIQGKLTDKPIFIGHGTQDDTVPVELARQAARRLEAAGAAVTYCEDSVGHKLSAGCFRGLAEFFKEND
jgi:phospholipase/carboxylesterase